MVRALLSIGVLLAAAVASFQAVAEASYPEIVRLVRSMREDELMLAALKAELPNQVGSGKFSKADAACLARIRYPTITDAIALVSSSELSDAEVADAIAFYRSESGRKFTERGYQELTKNLPPDTSWMTAADARTIGAFAKRPAGRKLIQDRITHQRAVVEKIGMRVKVAIDDCAYESEEDGAIQRPKRICETVPIAAPDNACTASQGFLTYATLGARTTVDISCIERAHHASVTAFNGRIEGLGLHWSRSGALEIILPANAKPERATPSLPIKVEFRQRQASDPPAAKCFDSLRDALAVEMDELASQPFWMSYGDETRCLLSKRIDRARLPGAKRDAVVQFRKLKSARIPYGTNELVMFEGFSQQVRVRAARVVGADAPAVEMKPGGPTAGFHLIGTAADQVLSRLAAGKVLQLEFEPGAGASFRMPLEPTDFDWSHPQFTACSRAL